MFRLCAPCIPIVSGTERAPTDAESAAHKSFLARENKVLAAIILEIQQNFLYLLGDPTDPVVVWTKLENTFQRKTWSNKLRLRKKLYSLKLRDGDCMQQHLKTFMELFDELSVVGDAVEEEDRVINMLASLPDSYSTLVTALEASDKVPTWESVT